MTPQPLLERLITHYPSYRNFMGYFTHKSQPVKSLRTVSRGPRGRCEEEVASGTLAELVDEDAEAPRGVTEAASHLNAVETVDEEGAEGLVLAMGGVGGFGEDLGEVR